MHNFRSCFPQNTLRMRAKTLSQVRRNCPKKLENIFKNGPDSLPEKWALFCSWAGSVVIISRPFSGRKIGATQIGPQSKKKRCSVAEKLISERNIQAETPLTSRCTSLQTSTNFNMPNFNMPSGQSTSSCRLVLMAADIWKIILS